MAEQLKKAKFAIINCNMDFSAYPKLKALIKPFVVKTIAGQKVAFIGAICPDLANVTYRSEKVRVINASGDWMSPVRDEIARVKEQGIDKIVLVTHVGVDRDRLLAELPDLDVIIGGHSHTRLDKPIVVDHADGSHCVVVQTGSYGRALGKLDLSFDNGGRLNLEKLNYKLLDITSGLPQDKKIEQSLDSEAKPFKALETQVLSNATDKFDNVWASHMGDSALGNLVADALAEGAAKYGATIAFENRGGIRAAIQKGEITAEDVEEMLPFANTLVVATINGADLRKVLEVSVAGSKERSVVLGAQYLDVHGLKFEWDPNAKPMDRVRNILALNSAGVYEPVKPDGEYRVAINDYAFEVEGFDFTRATNIVRTGARLSVYMHDYLQKHPTVSPKEDGRIVPLSGK